MGQGLVVAGAGVPDPAAAVDHTRTEVLIVEDDPLFAELVTDYLAGETANTTVTHTLAASLDRILAGRFDCIVLDLGLPDADGLDALDALLALDRPPPIVVVTGTDDPERATAAVARGAQDYLFKRDLDGANLTRAIRYAIERHCLETRLREAEHLEFIGRLAGRVAHDFNNLLTALFGHIEMARTQIGMLPATPRTRVTAHLDAIDATAERAATLTHQLLAYSRSAHVERNLVSVGQAIDELLPAIRPLLLPCEVEITRSEGPDHVAIDRSHFDEIVTNILRNAREAMPGHGTVRILIESDPPGTTESADTTASAALVRLIIADDGPGIDPAVRDRLFEPFVSTKLTGGGLGLATVRNIVGSVGGTVMAESPASGGARFTITLPLVDPPASNGVEIAAPLGARILVVDDDDQVRRFMGIVLRQAGHEVTEVTDPLIVEELVDRIGADLVITDVQMPTMSGIRLIEQLRVRHPVLPVLAISGYADDEVDRLRLDRCLGFLPKPFNGSTLRAAVDRALDTETR